MKRYTEDFIMMIVVVISLFSIVPVIAYSQTLYYEAVDQSTELCPYCDYDAVVDGTCMHCGKEI